MAARTVCKVLTRFPTSLSVRSSNAALSPSVTSSLCLLSSIRLARGRICGKKQQNQLMTNEKKTKTGHHLNPFPDLAIAFLGRRLCCQMDGVGHLLCWVRIWVAKGLKSVLCVHFVLAQVALRFPLLLLNPTLLVRLARQATQQQNTGCVVGVWLVGYPPVGGVVDLSFLTFHPFSLFWIALNWHVSFFFLSFFLSSFLSSFLSFFRS